MLFPRVGSSFSTTLTEGHYRALKWLFQRVQALVAPAQRWHLLLTMKRTCRTCILSLRQLLLWTLLLCKGLTGTATLCASGKR